MCNNNGNFGGNGILGHGSNVTFGINGVVTPGPVGSIYTAGPIDLGTDLVKWRFELRARLEIAGLKATIFDPSSAFKLSTPSNLNAGMSRYIESVNTSAIACSDLVIASLPSDVQSVGTIVEIDNCYKTGKEIWLMTDIPKGKSAYLINRIKPENWYEVKDGDVIDTIDAMVAALVSRGTK